MSNDTKTPTAGCCWLADVIAAAYPISAGVTLGAIEALSGRQSFTREQVAYLVSVALAAGAAARTEGERAEQEAARTARFTPAPTREERIRLRAARMAEQAELYRLHRFGEARPDFAGMSAERAQSALMWDADRPEPRLERGRLYVRPDGSWDAERIEASR